MNILLIENHLDLAGFLDRALEILDHRGKASIFETVDSIPRQVDIGNFQLALVDSHDLSSALKTIIFLRGRMPAGRIVACGEFDALDGNTPARLQDAGADIVIDTRFTPLKMAILIGRFVRGQHQAEPLAGLLSPA